MEVDLTRAIILQNKEFNGLETSRSADPTAVLELCQGDPELRRGVEKLVASRKRWKQQAQDREVSDTNAQADHFKLEHILRSTVASQQSKLRELEKVNRALHHRVTSLAAPDADELYSTIRGFMRYDAVSPKVPMPDLETNRQRGPFKDPPQMEGGLSPIGVQSMPGHSRRPSDVYVSPHLHHRVLSSVAWTPNYVARPCSPVPLQPRQFQRPVTSYLPPRVTRVEPRFVSSWPVGQRLPSPSVNLRYVENRTAPPPPRFQVAPAYEQLHAHYRSPVIRNIPYQGTLR